MDNTMTYTMSYQLPPTVACAAGCVLQWQVRDTWAAGRATTRACWRLMYIYNTPLGLYALLSLMIHTQARVRIQHHIRTMLRRAADMSLAVEPHMPLPTLVWGQHTHNCVFLPPLPPPPPVQYFAMQSCIEPGCNPAYCGVYAQGTNAVYGSRPGFCGTSAVRPEFFFNGADIIITPTSGGGSPAPSPSPAAPMPSPSPPPPAPVTPSPVPSPPSPPASPAVPDGCPAEPGAARAACVCQGKPVGYYADTLNNCTGASWWVKVLATCAALVLCCMSSAVHCL
jgi:hypothetical protein